MGAFVCHNFDNLVRGFSLKQPVLNFTMMVSRCVSAKRQNDDIILFYIRLPSYAGMTDLRSEEIIC